MLMKEIERMKQILIYSFSNLQCLTLDNTQLSSKANELTSFLSEKLRRIESDAYFFGKSTQAKRDFSSFLNLQHIKLKYRLGNDDERWNSRSRLIRNSLTKLSKLETLSICAILSEEDRYVFRSDPDVIFYPIMDELNVNQIKTEYEIKYSGDYMWCIRNTKNDSF
jgi:hypothetical protein